MPRKIRRVLVVDDNPAARNVVIHLLRRDRGFRVHGVASDGLEAIDLAGQDCPDLIVLDDDMPHMTGIEALPALRLSCPDAKIVLWTRDEPAAVGGDAWISKADGIDRLLDWLRAA